ncbi:hypothetical protein FPQ18DRAFT_36501 [Pyronema domesticum]|nr:hypothetical protein FPQ18DRAFT_36501 [Pyronema domesticum]
MSSGCWTRDVKFEDGLNIAKGWGELSSHAWGLKTLLRAKILSHKVLKTNPIELELRNKYQLPMGMERIIKSKVIIELDEKGKIKAVLDIWNGSLPDGIIARICSLIYSMMYERYGM